MIKEKCVKNRIVYIVFFRIKLVNNPAYKAGHLTF